MKTYFIRHAESLDIDDATRRRLWNEHRIGIRFPRKRGEQLGPKDNESLDPVDYWPADAVSIRALSELARDGGYVMAEYHEHDEYLVGRVEPGSDIEILRGRWGAHGAHPGREAVLKTLQLQDARAIPADDLADILRHRPRRGTLRRWRIIRDAVSQIVDGTGKVNRWEHARRTWNALVALAQRGERIEYGELGKIIGQRFPLAVRHPLTPIYWYCEQERLPPLTVLVVSKTTGLPSSGFGNIDEAEFTRLRAEVYAYDWTSTPNPYGFADQRIGNTDPITRLVEAPEEAEDVYRRVKDRGSPHILFREAVIRAYGGKCAFSGSRIREGLDAAHIIPWSNATLGERLSVRNGLLLAAWHHRLFDAGLLTLTEDYRIRVKWERLSSVSDCDRAVLALLDKKPIHLPQKKYRPDPALIRRREEILQSRDR